MQGALGLSRDICWHVAAGTIFITKFYNRPTSGQVNLVKLCHVITALQGSHKITVVETLLCLTACLFFPVCIRVPARAVTDGRQVSPWRSRNSNIAITVLRCLCRRPSMF